MDKETGEYLEKCATEDYWEYRAKNPEVSEGEAALQAILIYKACILPVPKWAIEEIGKCWKLYKEGRKEWAHFVDESGLPVEPRNDCVSLDEAFGLKKRQMRSVKAKNRRVDITWILCKKVEEYHAKGHPKKKDSPNKKSAFLLAGKDLGISEGLAEEIYREGERNSRNLREYLKDDI